MRLHGAVLGEQHPTCALVEASERGAEVVKVVDVAVTKSCSLMAHGDVRGRVFLHLGHAIGNAFTQFGTIPYIV